MKINILDFFYEMVEQKSNQVAIEHNGETLTFSGLCSKSELLCSIIQAKIGDTINSPIAILLPKGMNAVVADIASVMSGNPFMNLDVFTPVERLENILYSVKPALIITDEEHAGLLDIGNLPMIIMGGLDSVCDSQYLDFRWRERIDTDPFCIINTSGSTGTPKSVVLNHRSFFDFMEWSFDTFGFDGTEVIGSLSPLVFDIYVFELCLLMMKGAKISLLDASLATFPVKLVEKIRELKISFIFWVPTIMVNIANMDLLSGREPNELRLVWFAGEVFPTKQFLYWYDKLPATKFVNMYGPIEITLDCAFYSVDTRPDEDKPLPIGSPCKNTDIILLNDKDEEAGVGEEAELCVRGSSLAMGYYNNPEKTITAFVQNPLNKSYPEIIYRTGDIVYEGSDGLLYIKGRKDSMIKHNGYRIELAEIEHIIVNQLKLVRNCCAVYDKARKRIVLYYEGDTEITKVSFRKNLKDVLPKYMVPSEYIRVDEMPRNTNGKIDRLRLQESLISADSEDDET